MKPTITRFNDKTGDFEITIPVPFTLKDGIEYVGMMVADIPKYEDTKDYNVFDLIRENQELKKQLDYALKLLAEMFLPCERDGFMYKYSDYCQSNCGVDEEVFKKCWLMYIEDKLKEVE